MMNVRESKSAATIRRKRPQQGPSNAVLHRHKALDDQFDLSAEDPEYYSPEEVDIGPPLLRLMLANDWILFLGLLSFRTINALMIQTSYVPDEYWQSVEVAHNMAYGYGYLTWEWQVGLRGYSYPLIFATIYKILGIFHLDNRILLIKLPRLAQGVFAAVGDLYLYKLSRRLSGESTARLALLCQLTSWFTFYCCTRTLTNSMETVLTTVAMYYFPWPNVPRLAQYKYLLVVGAAVVVRPTAAIVWLPMCAWHVWMYRHVAWRIVKLFAEIGLAVLCLSSIVDRVWYGEWVHVHYNFLQFNVLSNMGAFYGSHPWHWYLTQGLAVVLGAHIFPFLLAARNATHPPMLGVVTWTVAVYSVLEHKEFRFLMPVLPLCFHITAQYLNTLCEDHQQDEGDSNDNDHPQLLLKTKQEDEEHASLPARPKKSDERQQPGEKKKRGWKRRKFVAAVLVALNVPVAVYASLIHQRGTVDVMRFLYDQHHTHAPDTPDTDTATPMEVMFLMPCHSTPFHSYLHENVSLQFLTCEPNLGHVKGYVDEADVFFSDPAAWLVRKYAHRPRHALPSHLVLFNVLEPSIRGALSRLGGQQGGGEAADFGGGGGGGGGQAGEGGGGGGQARDGGGGGGGGWGEGGGEGGRIKRGAAESGGGGGGGGSEGTTGASGGPPPYEGSPYETCAKLFHTHFPDGRVGSHVLVLCRTDWRRRHTQHKLKVEIPAHFPHKQHTVKI